MTCKLMSNFHTPEGGMVLRRVKGQADREERDAPKVGEDYNGKMGGTDLKDMMCDIYTVTRTGKEWWKTMWYWVLDDAMYNALVLYKWCHDFAGLPYKMTHVSFIRSVCDHYLLSPTSTSEVISHHKRVAVRRSTKHKLLTSPPTPITRLLAKGSPSRRAA